MTDGAMRSQERLNQESGVGLDQHGPLTIKIRAIHNIEFYNNQLDKFLPF